MRSYVLDSSVWTNNVKFWYEEGNNAMVGYYTCTTSGGTAAKTVNDASGYVLSLGGSMKIKFTNKHTGNNTPTLNINGQGSKNIIYDGSICSSTNTWENGETVECYYDGSVYQLNSYWINHMDNEPIKGSENPVKSNGIEKVTMNSAVETIQFSGNNNTGVFKYFNLIPNKQYRISLSKTIWGLNNVSSAIFQIFHHMNDSNQFDVVVYKNQTVNDYYNIYTQECDYYSIGIRADIGEKIEINVSLIDDTIKLSQSIDDFDISDKNGYAIVKFQNGHIRTKNFDSSQCNTDLYKIKEKTDNIDFDQSVDDFDILDESGRYAIVKFQNGHIRTKNFDSSDINPNLKGKRYSIIGDSISTYQGYLPSNEQGYDGSTYAYFYPRTGLNDVNQTWWKKMEAITGLSLLRNCSWSGSECCGNSTSTTSAEAGCSTRRVSDLSKNGIIPDIIIIYIGINDMNTYTLGSWTANEEIPTEGTVIEYAKAYALCVSKVMRAYPSSEVYCCSLLECPTVDSQTGTKTFPCINTHGETLKQYNDTIKDICVGLGANFIDLHACGINYWNCYPTYFLDTTHPNSTGTTLMAKYISQKILTTTKLKY